jgi:foldase protein PrsA
MAEVHNPSSNKNIYYLIAAAIVILGGIYYFNNKKTPIATVNGTNISRDAYIAELESQGGKQILDQLITEELVVAKAVENNLTVSPEEVDAEIATIRNRILGPDATDEDFNQALTAQGMTLASFQKRIYIQKLLEAIMAKDIEISDADIDAYLADNVDINKAATDEAKLRADIKDMLLQDKIQASQSAYLEDLKSAADIKYW